MEVNYELTQQDFFQSYMAHRNRSFISKWSFRLLISIALLFAALGVVLLVIRRDAETISTVFPLFGLSAAWVVIFWLLPWWTARNQFSKQPAAHGTKRLIVQAGGPHWEGSGGNADIKWQAFIRCVEGKNQFLLYSSPACFHIIPKRAFTSDQLAEFRELLAQNIQERR